MPLNYQFLDSETKSSVALNTIDEEICKDFNIKCDANIFSIQYQLISMIGDYSCKSGSFNLDDFNYATKDMNEEQKFKIMKYIFGKYIYKSWYCR